jgi:SulP family sulfate permease
MTRYFSEEFIPKTYVCLKEGYSKHLFLQDLFAGFAVGIIALPLAMAFAIGSGVAPERGLFTAIIAGFLISLLGGSRVQIGGPTGAFVVIVYSIVQRHGYDGLAIATLMAGVMMLLMGLARFGVFLKFIPYPVTTGFTTGIALIIFSSQVKDFFGLDIATVPADFLEKWTLYFHQINSLNPWAFLIGGGTLGAIFLFRAIYPKLPGAILAVGIASFLVWYFGLPIETIETRFGGIPQSLPIPTLPTFSLDKIQAVFPDAVTIAMLGAIESLLSALVADGMTGNKHRSNCELLAQGFANIGSILFGGIPATGAIARTTANINMGAKTPFAGMIHAITLLLLMMLCAPWAAKFPMASLAAVLVYVAWNMSERDSFREILKGPRSDGIVLVITFLLTVLIDLTVAVQVGVLLAAVLFLKQMTDTTTIKICKILLDENNKEVAELHDSEILFRKDIPNDTAIFEINGPFFYSVSNLLNEELRQLPTYPKYFILRMRKVPLIDSTGLSALKNFSEKCKKLGITFLLSGVRPDQLDMLKNSSVYSSVGANRIFPHLNEALAFVRAEASTPGLNVS